MARDLRAVVVIPAYNEGATIGGLLSQLVNIKARAPSLISKIVVVNDGSTDRTGRTAARYADKVVNFETNRGKAEAFYEGVKIAAAYGSPAMITLDGDLKGVSAAQLVKLVLPLGKPAGGGVVGMSVALEKGSGFALSGQRAFLTDSLKCLQRSRKLRERLLRRNEKIRGGYGLERFLNRLFENRAAKAKVSFEAGPTTLHRQHGRLPGDRERLFSEIAEMEASLSRRKKLAGDMRETLAIRRKHRHG